MATRDTYTMQEWENLPAKTTPVNAERLSHIEQGIKDAADKRALKEIYDDRAMSLGRKSGYRAGYNSVAAGYEVIAMGEGSYAGGNETKAYADYSHAEGDGTIAGSSAQNVEGRYNVQDGLGIYVHITGGGTSDSDRRNIYTLDWNGNAIFAGDVKATYNNSKISLIDTYRSIYSMGEGLTYIGNKVNSLSDRVDGMSEAKVFSTKDELDEWLAVEGNQETLKVGQNIYVVETGTPDYWWDGTGMQVLETDKVVVESMTYDETMAILNET